MTAGRTLDALLAAAVAHHRAGHPVVLDLRPGALDPDDSETERQTSD